MRVVGSVPDAGRRDEQDLRTILGKAVSFTGYVDDRQLAQEYLAADVLGFPSLFEGFGIPALEAMCADLPVVVSDTTSLPEVVGDAGAVIPARDVGAWESALRRVHDNPTWREDMVSRGRRRAAQFTWRQSAATVLDTLRRVASRAGNR